MSLTRTEVKNLLLKYEIHPKKSLGQNFVVEPNTIRQIIKLADLDPANFVIEVGSGLGSLTLALLESCEHVTAVEVDDVLVKILKEVTGEQIENKLRIIHADVMTLDLKQVLEERSNHWNLVANLPYNIAVPMICDFLEKAPLISKMTVMVQREVAERMIAKVGDKAYGLPSVKIEYFAEAKIIADIPPTVFIPKPRVESSIVQIVRRDNPIISEDYEILFSLIKSAFRHRRKMLRSSLKGILSTDDFTATEIDPTKRAENLTLKEWELLTKQIVSRGHK
ncbi:MAG TPA: 16S rRNA (adenine(1518)-N(6)/adenine(1519)-N(6))-dimethyltransferase RsmA [Acidimicrobiales bacterium]|nr:16S rRNA (adenine(1518)-N(6)/adenine(1519)-N(6))-dimethyltransferase RsmA [Acidimicrobiales bacterium]